MHPVDEPHVPQARPRTGQYAKAALKIGVTVLGLLLVWRSLDLSTLLAVMRQVNWSWIAVGAIFVVLSLVVRAYRWHVVLHGVGSAIRFTRLVELYLVGSFFNAFLPSGLGGDVVRATEAAQDVEPEIAVGTVIVDRLTGLMALFGMALLTLTFRPPSFPDQLAWVVGLTCVTGLVLGLAVIDGRLLHMLTRRLSESRQSFDRGLLRRTALTIDRCGWRSMMAALGVSVAFNLIQVAWWATTGRALGLDIPFTYYVLVVPLMAIALLIPSIGGLGVRESLAPLVFAGAGISPEQAVALTLLVFGLERVASLFGAPVYIYIAIQDARRRREPDQVVRPR